MKLTSPAFADGGVIPAEYTCDGAGANPPLACSKIPAQTKSLALIVDDPDSPRGFFTHWLIWNIPPLTSLISTGSTPPGAVEGSNDFGKTGWGGPCPNQGEHRYVFTLYALETDLDIPAGATKEILMTALDHHVLDSARLTGRYQRK